MIFVKKKNLESFGHRSNFFFFKTLQNEKKSPIWKPLFINLLNYFILDDIWSCDLCFPKIALPNAFSIKTHLSSTLLAQVRCKFGRLFYFLFSSSCWRKWESTNLFKGESPVLAPLERFYRWWFWGGFLSES
jgi:hypothetical protein